MEPLESLRLRAATVSVLGTSEEARWILSRWPLKMRKLRIRIRESQGWVTTARSWMRRWRISQTKIQNQRKGSQDKVHLTTSQTGWSKVTSSAPSPWGRQASNMASITPTSCLLMTISLKLLTGMLVQSLSTKMVNRYLNSTTWKEDPNQSWTNSRAIKCNPPFRPQPR